MTMPLVPDTRTPASKPTEVMLIDFVMVTAPKPPGSRTLISPPGAVLEMAPANVLQGAVRLQGLASSPTPDTQVRGACACANEATVKVKTTTAKAFKVLRNLRIDILLIAKVMVTVTQGFTVDRSVR